MQDILKRVDQALADLKAGKMIILTDHPDRENEGDLIVAAEKVTAENMNFMIRNGTGIVCLPMPASYLQKLQLPLMVPPHANTCLRGTQFTVSIDATEGISTGVSAADRAHTVLVAINDDAKPEDLVRPGHIFPLLAKEQGVLERQGHTEGSIDLMRLAGFKPAAVLCEIMNPDGTMTRGKELVDFSEKHDLTLLSIDDILAYRLHHESLIEEEANTTLSLKKYGQFQLTVIKEKMTGQEHVVLSKPKIDKTTPTLVRIHSSCATGDLFASTHCDCHQQLHHALEKISQEGGMLIYLNQEGRGIGLLNKIKAYALQEQGLDTIEANIQLGLPIDARNYAIAANILHSKNITHIQLLTNNPNKIEELKRYGIMQVDRISMPSFHNEQNQFYLETKKAKLNHHIQFENIIKEIAS